MLLRTHSPSARAAPSINVLAIHAPGSAVSSIGVSIKQRLPDAVRLALARTATGASVETALVIGYVARGVLDAHAR